MAAPAVSKQEKILDNLLYDRDLSSIRDHAISFGLSHVNPLRQADAQPPPDSRRIEARRYGLSPESGTGP